MLSQKIFSVRFYKWINLIAFSFMYLTMYIGRFNFNSLLPDIAADLAISGTIQNILYSSVFFSYAVGCLINGYLADTFRPKILIVFGFSGSIAANLIIPAVSYWPLMLAASLLNGYCQSMVWVSGISLLVKWWKQGERGVAVGVANMSSSISYIIMLSVPYLGFLNNTLNWRDNILFPMIYLAYFLILFFAISRERPEDIGCKPYEESGNALEKESALEEIPQRYSAVLAHFFSQKSIWFWCIIGLLSNLCRYGILAWLPAYYIGPVPSLHIGEYFSNVIISAGMACGTLIIVIIAGRFFPKNKGILVTGCAALAGAVITSFPMISSSTMVMIAMFATGFFVYAINGLLWIHAMDMGGRRFAGTLAGFFNCFSYLGATIQKYIFSAVLYSTDDWVYLFMAIEFLCMVIVVFGLLANKRPL